MVDRNAQLAFFINSFGSMNNYGATMAQTKRALDEENAKSLKNAGDRAIFLDALDGIEAIQKDGFSAEGIIAINKSFTHSEEEDPVWPGHLRNAMYNEDDRIAIKTGAFYDQDGRYVEQNYHPVDWVKKEMLQEIVDQFNQSPQTRFDGWRVFAQLAKLQAFQDGNKRTALIAANAALNTWQQQDYLAFPLNNLDNTEFMVNLMRYYQAQSPEDEGKYLQRMSELAPNKQQQLAVWQREKQTTKRIDQLPTKKVKPMFPQHKHRR